MSDCLHCDINELVTKYAERADGDASELAARMAESLVDLILMAPDSDRATLLADVIAVLGQLYLEKSGVVEPGEFDRHTLTAQPIDESAMSSPSHLRLGVNIDHVATIRNARGGHHPDPVQAAKLAIEAGADGITAHLREDRRHIRDDDIARLKVEIAKPLNLEMAATDEMVAIAIKTRPHAACLVPERREERTTEGGLDVAGQSRQLAPAVAQLRKAGIRVSLFIAADPAQIAAAVAVGAPVIEIHTGAWCDALAEGRAAATAEWERIQDGARLARRFGLEVHAGHGLNYATAEMIAALPEIVELNIGHFLVGEAAYGGLPQAVRSMRAAMDRGRATVPR